MNRRVLVVALAAVVVAQAAVAVFEAGRYVQRAPRASQQAVPRPLLPVQVDPAWIRSGTPRFSATEALRSPDGRSASGLWACEGPASFEWTFALDETVQVLEGEVHIDYRGHRFTLGPGDSATFAHGSKAVWMVPQRLKKAYTLHQPPRLVRLWRWATGEG